MSNSFSQLLRFNTARQLNVEKKKEIGEEDEEQVRKSSNY